MSLRGKSSKSILNHLKYKSTCFFAIQYWQILTTPRTRCDVPRGKNTFCWPTASALGLLDTESKNFIFVLQGYCDLHVKCCRRMQPDVTGFRKIRMCDLDGFKQCKLGLRYVNIAPVQFAPVHILRGWVNKTRKRMPNWQHKWDINTSGRKFTNQLQYVTVIYNKRKLCN